MIVVVKVSRRKGSKVIVPFMIFQNDRCRYSISGIPNNIHGIFYYTPSNGFMTFQVLLNGCIRGMQIFFMCMVAKSIFIWIITWVILHLWNQKLQCCI